MSGDLLLPVALMVLGFVLLGLELVIIPGFGLPGLLGLGSLGAGSFMLWESGGPLLGTVGITLSLLAAIGSAIWFARSRTARGLVLADEVTGTSSPTETLASLVGRDGIAVAALRPSGVVEVAGERYDAVLRDGGFVAAGGPIRIIGQEHGQLIAEPINTP